MKYLVTGEQMKAVDKYTIETIGIPSLVLMERAAAAVAEETLKTAKMSDHIWVVCGTGNNGADGIAAARMMKIKGYSVTVIIAGNEAHGTQEFHLQKEIAGRLEVPMAEWKDFLPGRCDILIDAVFGVGLGREIQGEYRDVIQMMRDAGAGRTIAVDMPSGIHSGTGQIMGIAVKADVTVTFGYEKLGCVLYPGREYCGSVVVADIGFPPVSLSHGPAPAWTYTEEDLCRIPERKAYSNKGTFGKVLLIAGSVNMSGAAYLSGLAAYRMGAGLVKIMTVEENRAILQQLLPEAILTVCNPQDALEDREAWERMIERECAWADVIVAGPGLGQETYAAELVKGVLTHAYVPMVLDADGLNIIASHKELTQYYTENIIITPHLGEMARLTGKEIAEIQRELVKTAGDYSSSHGITCVLKDAATVAAGRDGQIFVNTSGNSAMAKAGSGDVLAGTIAGLLAQGMDVFEAASLGVYIHGLAGDRYRKKNGAQGLLARELAEEIGRLTAGEEA